MILYWLKRLTKRLFAVKHEKFCPECLSKLKESEKRIIYHTLEEDVIGMDPEPRTYFYCPNTTCAITGVAENPHVFYDMFGESYGGSTKWYTKNRRLVSYTEANKFWLFKKGTAAVNSPAAKFDFTVCVNDNFVWDLVAHYRSTKNTIVYNAVKKIHYEKENFWSELHAERKKIKYFFLTLVGMFQKIEKVR